MSEHSTENDAHSEGCRKWMEAAPGQRKCVCSVGWPERVIPPAEGRTS